MKTMLFPTDFSKNANNALKYAGVFAQAVQCKLKLLHVYTPSFGRHSIISGVIAEETAMAQVQAQKQLNKLCTKYIKTSCSGVVKIGTPVDEIINASKKDKADIIIMGTHGATGLNKILFGSNTSGVISKSPIPVLAIPRNYRFKKINTIVYASDFKNPVNELKFIIRITKRLNATIEILNLDYGWNKNEGKKKIFERKIKALAYKKIKLVEQKGSVETTMVAQIKEYLRKRKPELLVMFPENKTGFGKLFIRSKTEELAHQLTLPLLSIRKSIV